MKTLIDIIQGIKEVSIRIVLGFFLGVSITGVLYFAAQLIILFELY